MEPVRLEGLSVENRVESDCWFGFLFFDYFSKPSELKNIFGSAPIKLATPLTTTQGYDNQFFAVSVDKENNPAKYENYKN